jgi:hypothetical protein
MGTGQEGGFVGYWRVETGMATAGRAEGRKGSQKNGKHLFRCKRLMRHGEDAVNSQPWQEGVKDPACTKCLGRATKVTPDHDAEPSDSGT